MTRAARSGAYQTRRFEDSPSTPWGEQKMSNDQRLEYYHKIYTELVDEFPHLVHYYELLVPYAKLEPREQFLRANADYLLEQMGEIWE